MKKLYVKLAYTNIKNNRQFYIPYILTGIMCVLMYYSMIAMQQNPAWENVIGGSDIKSILIVGTGVIGFFSCIFLFYTNSFIIKRRKKELGIYNILGMEKRHIVRVMLVETFALTAIIIVGGLVLGIIFNKLLMMFLYRLTRLNVSIPFYISNTGCRYSAIYDNDKIIINDKSYEVKANVVHKNNEAYMMTGGEGYIIAGDEETFYSIYDEIYEYYEQNVGYELTVDQTIYLDLDGSSGEKLLVDNSVGEAVTSWKDEEHARYSENPSDSEFIGVTYETRQNNRESFYTLYGSLFFLGLFLGIMFLMITVLIIFYKQISEGYDDKERFAIMEKVGMSSDEVKASINSQIRIVFFMPLLVAAIHLAAAFPMLIRILALLNLTNIPLFAWCLAGTLLIFGIIYFAVFKLTSKTYYSIVGRQV